MPRRCYLFVDVQKFMFDELPSTETLVPRWTQLLDSARKHATGDSPDTLVAHVQHNDEGAVYGSPSWELFLSPIEGETRVYKDVVPVFDANPNLAEELRAQGVKEVVISGCQSDYCVRAATRGALKEGFQTVLLSGAHHTSGESFDIAQSLARKIDEEMKQEGARVVPWDQYVW